MNWPNVQYQWKWNSRIKFKFWISLHSLRFNILRKGMNLHFLAVQIKEYSLSLLPCKQVNYFSFCLEGNHRLQAISIFGEEFTKYLMGHTYSNNSIRLFWHCLIKLRWLAKPLKNGRIGYSKYNWHRSDFVHHFTPSKVIMPIK